MPSIGTHRVEHVVGENGVWISGERGGSEILESRYVASRYWPHLIDLPWGSANPFGLRNREGPKTN